MRHFSHHIGDYAAATQHLSFVEDAAYHRMIRLYYQTEAPLPADMKKLARLVGARTKEEREAVATVAEEFFTLESDGLHQRRCDAEIARYQEKSSSASRAGRLGGRPPRSAKPLKEKETDKANAFIPESEPFSEKKPTSQPLTLNQEEKKESSSLAGTESGSAGSAPASGDPPPIPDFLKRAGRSAPIEPDWQPSETAMAQLRTSRPDLTDEAIALRMVEFHAWCASTAKTTFNPDATWLGFMVKTHAQRSHDRQQPDQDPVAAGVRESLARRHLLAGG